VDHAAEVEISGDMGLLTTTAGRAANWRRFQCNAPPPRHPGDFRFVRVAGRGTFRLTQDPRSTGGRAVVQIYDPQAGRANYTFDLEWQGRGGGGWNPEPGPRGPWHGPGGFPMGAIRACQDSVTDRLNRDGYSYITFDRTVPDNQPDRNGLVSGRVSAQRAFRTTWFGFSCSVDFRSGWVRSVDVSRR
jgi:hypothetical protein